MVNSGSPQMQVRWTLLFVIWNSSQRAPLPSAASMFGKGGREDDYTSRSRDRSITLGTGSNVDAVAREAARCIQGASNLGSSSQPRLNLREFLAVPSQDALVIPLRPKKAG